MTAATRHEVSTETAPQTFKHLTMCVVEETGSPNLSIAIYNEYRKCTVDMLDNNEGDNHIVRTNEIAINRFQTRNEVSTIYQMAMPWYQCAGLAESAITDRAEFHGKNVSYEQQYALFVTGVSAIEAMNKPSVIAENNPTIKRVGLPCYGLEKSLAAFGLTVKELSEKTLKEKTGLDVMLVPEDSITEDMKGNLPKNVLTYNGHMGTPEGNKQIAREAAEKTNAYFFALNN